MVLVYWSVAKFKSLASNTKQFDEFAGICEETFFLDHAAAESQLGTSSQDPAALAPGTCLQEPTDPVPGTSSQDPAEQAPGTSSQDPAVLAPGTSAQASGEPRSSQALDPVTTLVSWMPSLSGIFTKSEDFTLRKAKLRK